VDSKLFKQKKLWKKPDFLCADFEQEIGSPGMARMTRAL
jgi:hypothetical protein